jgi:hypothetical protein
LHSFDKWFCASVSALSEGHAGDELDAVDAISARQSAAAPVDLRMFPSSFGQANGRPGFHTRWPLDARAWTTW